MKKVKWILGRSFRFSWRPIAIYSLLLLGTLIVNLMVNVVNKNIINELISNTVNGTISTVLIVLIATHMCLYLIRGLSGFIRAFGINRFQFEIEHLFHRIFMWRSYRTKQEKFFDHEFMDKYSFVYGGIEKIGSYIDNLLSFLILNIGTIIGTIVLFAIYEPRLIMFSIVLCVSTVAINKYISEKEFELDKKVINEQRFHDYYKDILCGKDAAKELRIFKLKDFFYQKWATIFEQLRIKRLTIALKKITLDNLHDIFKYVLRVVSILLLLLGIYQKRYDVGTFVLLYGLLDTCTYQINDLADTLVSGAYKESKYLNEYYDFVFPITDSEIKTLLAENVESDSLPFGDFYEISANSVSYTYPNAEAKAVDNLTLTIRRGEIISILGYNGSGKTTLSKLLTGSLIPQEGTVLLNNTQITEENKMSFFKYFGFAPQDFSHFSLPIKDFVGLGRIEIMDNACKIEDAYIKAGVTELIARYPQGDKTVLGKMYDEEGVELSGGEWQKFVIASAYMGEPEILILDEPTASIDPLKELEMLSTLRDNLRGKTAILISHRIGFARIADRIVIMQDGRIVEQGTHEELLKLHGFYSVLFNEQKKLYEDEVTNED